MKRNATLIHNPHAGSWEWSNTVEQVAEVWRANGWTIDLQPTRYPGHATELARQAGEKGHGLALVAGGDGTLNEAVNGLVHTQTTLVALPVGTANSFAKEIGIVRPGLLNPNWPQIVYEQVIDGHVHKMDVGCCENNQRYWLLWAGVGVDSFMVEHVEPRSKEFKILGPAGYFAKALSALPNFPGMTATVTVDERTVTGDFLLITVINSRRFAGGEIILSPDAMLDDGQFEVWLFRGRQWIGMMRYAIEMGLQFHPQNPDVEVLQGRTVRIETDPTMPYHLDAEPIGRSPLACRMEAGALRVLVPKSASRELFVSPGQPLEM